MLGTSLERHGTAGTEAAASAAEEATLATVDRLHGVLSGWRPDSEFTRWCTTWHGDVPVRDALLEVLDRAEQ